MPFSSSQTVTNLGTTTVNIPTTDVYTVKGKLQLPTMVTSATQGAGGGAGTGTGGMTVDSQVVVTVKQNGSTILTMPAGAQGFALYAINCTAGDVITVITSSSLAQDQQLNAVQMTLTVSEGM